MNSIPGVFVLETRLLNDLVNRAQPWTRSRAGRFFVGYCFQTDVGARASAVGGSVRPDVGKVERVFTQNLLIIYALFIRFAAHV
jgi:hypothetical protein